jgi:hypothetical protein
MVPHYHFPVHLFLSSAVSPVEVACSPVSALGPLSRSQARSPRRVNGACTRRPNGASWHPVPIRAANNSAHNLHQLHSTGYTDLCEPIPLRCTGAADQTPRSSTSRFQGSARTRTAVLFNDPFAVSVSRESRAFIAIRRRRRR